MRRVTTVRRTSPSIQRWWLAMRGASNQSFLNPFSSFSYSSVLLSSRHDAPFSLLRIVEKFRVMEEIIDPVWSYYVAPAKRLHPGDT